MTSALAIQFLTSVWAADLMVSDLGALRCEGLPSFEVKGHEIVSRWPGDPDLRSIVPAGAIDPYPWGPKGALLFAQRKRAGDDHSQLVLRSEGISRVLVDSPIVVDGLKYLQYDAPQADPAGREDFFLARWGDTFGSLLAFDLPTGRIRLVKRWVMDYAIVRDGRWKGWIAAQMRDNLTNGSLLRDHFLFDRAGGRQRRLGGEDRGVVRDFWLRNCK